MGGNCGITLGVTTKNQLANYRLASWTQALATSGTPCSLGSVVLTIDLRPPPPQSATRLLPRVPSAGALGRFCRCHRRSLPKQVAGSQPDCCLCLWAASPQGLPHHSFSTPLWFLFGYEGLAAVRHRIGAEPGSPLQSASNAHIPATQSRTFSAVLPGPDPPTSQWATCGNDHWRWHTSSSLSHFLLSVSSFSHLPEISLPEPPLPRPRRGHWQQQQQPKNN